MKHRVRLCRGCAILSLPSWERGLKQLLLLPVRNCVTVAPLVGAWIETGRKRQRTSRSRVAPLVGAWIETKCYKYNAKNTSLSLPSWERGLKRKLNYVDTPMEESLPSWERGLKHTTRGIK